MNSQHFDNLHAKVVNKTKASFGNNFFIKPSSIQINGDIHQDYKATTSFSFDDAQYFHKWHDTINQSSINELISSIGINIQIPSIYFSGSTYLEDDWIIQRAVKSKQAFTLPDILHRCFLIGQAFVFFYIFGTTDCHNENFAFSDDSLCWLDSETFLSAYYFKNLKLVSQFQTNLFSNRDFNLSELLKTNQIEGTNNTADYSLFHSFTKSLPVDVDKNKLLIAIYKGIDFAYNSCLNSKNLIFDWILCNDIESTRVIIRATRIYEQIVLLIFSKKNEIEKEFCIEQIFKSMYDLGISEHSYLFVIKQISLIEINFLKQGFIPKFRIKDLPLETISNYSLAKKVENRIDCTSCTELIHNFEQIINNIS